MKPKIIKIHVRGFHSYFQKRTLWHLGITETLQNTIKKPTVYRIEILNLVVESVFLKYTVEGFLKM